MEMDMDMEMETVAQPKEVDLFGSELPSFEKLKQLAMFVNSNEINKEEFADEVKANALKNLPAGIGFYILGEDDKAVKKLQKATPCAESLMYLGRAFRRLKMFDEAINSFEGAAKKQIDPFVITLEKADTFRMAGNLDKADKELQSCSNYNKVSAEYHFQLGRLADAKSLYSEAMDNYVTAIELDPNHAHALFYLAYACDLRGDEDAAIDYYNQMLKITPTYANAILNLAVLYEDQGEYEKAADCVYVVLMAHPNNKRALLYMKDIESAKVMVYDEEKEKQRTLHYMTLDIPISDFELSVRSRNCLRKMGIISVGDLLKTTETELLAYKNFGETSLIEIKKILKSKDLTLGMAMEDKDTVFVDDDDNDENKEMLNKTVGELGLSVRSKRALERLGVNILFDLVNKTEAELLGCKNFGMTSLNEIKERLENFGLGLRKLE